MRPPWLWKERGQKFPSVNLSSMSSLALGVKEWFLVTQDYNLDVVNLVHLQVPLFISHFNTILNSFIC